MPRVINTANNYIAIGENIHATRALRRDGKRVETLADGTEGVPFKDIQGESHLLNVPEHFKKTQPYEQGQIKHFMIAIWKGVHGNADDQEQGAKYVVQEAQRQEKAGARFLDLNVDEVSHDLAEQKRAMQWLVKTVQKVATVPLSIDSSNSEIIAEGLAAYDGVAGSPLLNSVALERVDALDLVERYNSHVMLTAASADGMPEDAEDRLENAGRLIEETMKRGIEPDRVYIDPLAFPISVSKEYGRHFLDAVTLIRTHFGNDIHISGGMSNVSFGLPKRLLINDVFIHLAIEHGSDSGIIDPLNSTVSKIIRLDMKSSPVRLATAMLLGDDEFCTNYIQAYREGRLG